VVFYATVQAASVALKVIAGRLANRREPESRREDREFYRTERLPFFAPPAAAFPIAWTINSVSAIAGGLHVLNLPPDTEGRREFLRLQAVAWTLFSTFQAGYFGLRSPINAALITVAYTSVTAASLVVALQRLKDPAAAVSLASTAAWLVLATPLGVTQAAWNYDPFWNTGPWTEPRKHWLKNRSMADTTQLA